MKQSPIPSQNGKVSAKGFSFLIISKLPIFAIGMEAIISQNFEGQIQRVEKARAALDLCARRDFDVILLGVTKPDRSGLDVLPDFRRRCPNGRVLIVSMLREEDFAARALKAGAAGYILKSSPVEELVRAIRVALEGGKYISQEFAAKFAHSFQAVQGKPHETLSPREFEVFLRIARGGSVKEIAAELSLSVKTISTYHTNIIDKLKIRNDAELGEYALRQGLIA
ncbi:MAG TPA: response regulator transcription factor [Chthoniobacterales bacterium]|jgi:DNA-binding NarL/FixJ family response regulator|nr:response regulator transcription factor [Chthoniobacterales bacterium]